MTRKRLFSWKNSNFLNPCDKYTKEDIKHLFDVFFNYSAPIPNKWFAIKSNFNLLFKNEAYKKNYFMRQKYYINQFYYYNTRIFKKISLLKPLLKNRVLINSYRLLDNNRLWNNLFFNNALFHLNKKVFLLDSNTNNSVKLLTSVSNRYGLIKLKTHLNCYSQRILSNINYNPFVTAFKLKRTTILPITLINEYNLINDLNLAQNKVNNNVLFFWHNFNILINEDAQTLNIPTISNIDNLPTIHLIRRKSLEGLFYNTCKITSIKNKLIFHIIFNQKY